MGCKYIYHNLHADTWCPACGRGRRTRKQSFGKLIAAFLRRFAR